jgi:type IV pilus assembly protein PilY1
MKYLDRYIYLILCAWCLAWISSPAHAQTINDYTAYPPFVTNAVEPNILLVLDHSGSMQFPAYTGCDFGGYSSGRAWCGTSNSLQDPQYAYDASKDYYGYFKTDKYYQYSSNKFVENSSCTDTDKIGSPNCISGNLLNWATMSRIDLMRKALMGGKSVSVQGNNHTLRGEGGWRTFDDLNLGCTISLSGGSYPNLDHVLTISNSGMTGTCGYLTVWANGSSIWGTSDKFRYVYQSISGDFDVKLRVVSPPTETGQTYAKAGLMVRASTNSNSQHVMVVATNGAGLQFATRQSNGGYTGTFGNYVSINYPVWVRLVRSGNNFTAYYSSNGSSWTQHASTTVNMSSNVLVGMATASYSSGSLGTGEYDEFICDVCTDDDFNDQSFNTSVWTALDINTGVSGSQTESCSGGCPVGTLSNANTRVDIPERDRKGLIQRLSDKDDDGNWDANAPRFGLMVYASNGRYGEMRVGINGSNMSSFLSALQNETPYYGTPTGEALREAYDYFIQQNTYPYESNNAFIQGPGSSKDPMCDSGTPVECRKNFILLISDGEWNGGVDPVIPARQSYVNDIRSDIDGVQNLITYSVYTFGSAGAGRNSMQQIAMYGGFDDYDSNTWPYDRNGYPSDSRNVTLPASPCDPGSPPMNSNCKEWDKDGDGLPDNYFEASEGNELESSLLQAISEILKRSSSGTAVSVLATTGEGEGAVYQAYFYPEKLEDINIRKWLGYIHALFVDKYGNLREDTNNNDALDLSSDFIIEMDYDLTLGSIVKKYSDTDADGQKDSSTPSAIVNLDSINAIWNGGEILWETSPSARTIYTSVDGYNLLDFSTANITAIEPFLRAADTVEATNIINWVRGDDLTGVTDTGHPNGYRQRNITINNVNHVWKLGDIVHSTPSVIARPMENYDLLYGDSTYSQYRLTYLKRRHVVYVGANDGMLHAFNAGCYDESSHTYYPDVDASGNCSSGSHQLGEELWAFIPRGLLPHLKWNTDPDYTHVYYVDLKPKISDVQIFTPDNTHVNGWGTILIGGFRYGGKAISWSYNGSNYSSSPEYFALDVTDPLNPRLLWTFSDPDLGLSMSYPAIAKVSGDWYILFGSGATDYDSGSNLTTFQDGNIFALKISSGVDGVIDTWTENSNYWQIPSGNSTAFMSDPISVDVDIDYDVDVMYIGENYKQGGKWNALMHRLTTGSGSLNNPSQWVLSTLADVDAIAGNKDDVKKITSAPSAAMDDRANLWLFFGTGQFLGIQDKNQTDTGAFYAIKDSCWSGSCTTSFSSLIDVSGATVMTDGTVSGISGSCGSGASSWGNLLTASQSCDGWSIYFKNLGENIDFTGSSLSHDGERVLSKPLVLGGLVTWATYIPGINVCSYEGESNVYAVYYLTGTAYNDYVFQDQKNQSNPSNVVARVKRLGAGMPSSLSAQVTAGGTAKGFVQQSTGSILEIENVTPISLQSGVTGWKSEQIP